MHQRSLASARRCDSVRAVATITVETCCFARSYCWIRNTYYLPAHEDVPSEEEAVNRPRLPYYQWVPMILLVQVVITRMLYKNSYQDLFLIGTARIVYAEQGLCNNM